MKSMLFYGFLPIVKNRTCTVFAWLLLVFFTGGQVLLFAHRHRLDQSAARRISRPHPQSLTEKCPLCDAMRFSTMVADENASVVHLLVAAHYDHKAVPRNFISLSLILSTGRAPPVG